MQIPSNGALYATVGAFSLYYPNMPWEEYLNSFLSGIVKVNDEEVLEINVFFEGIYQLLKVTPPRILANYLTWRVILDSIIYIRHDGLIKSRLNVLSAKYGITKYPPRCEFLISNIFFEFYLSNSINFFKLNCTDGNDALGSFLKIFI